MQEIKKKKKMDKSSIIMWIICVGIIVGGAIIVIADKMPEKGSSYDHMKYSDYITQLGKYEGLAADQEKVSVTKKDVKAEIDSRVSEQATTKEVKKGKVKDGDTVNINYEGTMNGEKFVGGSAKDQTLQIGSGSMIKGFESGLIGKNVGDTVKLDLTFPKDYDNKELAGKPVTFDITINALEIPVEYSYDETFLKKFTEFDNKKDYEASVKKELIEERTDSAKTAAKDSLWQQVLAETKIKEYPKPLYKTEKQRLMDSEKSMAEMYGMDWDSYLQSMGMSDEAYNEHAKEEAKELLKSNITAYYIADKENIQVDEKDAISWVKEQLKKNDYSEKEFEEQNGMPIEEYVKENDIVTEVVRDRVQDLVYEKAKITEVKPSAEDETE